ADLVLRVEADLPAKVGLVAVLPFAACQELDAACDVEILVADAVGLDGDVVSEVPALKEPGGNQVWLEVGQLGNSTFQRVSLVFLLLLDGLHPQAACHHAAQATQGGSCRRAEQVGVAAALLEQTEPARFRFNGIGSPSPRHRQQRHDDAQVDELALKDL